LSSFTIITFSLWVFYHRKKFVPTRVFFTSLQVGKPVPFFIDFHPFSKLIVLFPFRLPGLQDFNFMPLSKKDKITPCLSMDFNIGSQHRFAVRNFNIGVQDALF